MRSRHDLSICKLSVPVSFHASDLAEFTQQMSQALNSGLFVSPGFELRHVTEGRIEKFEITAPSDEVFDKCQRLTTKIQWFSYLVYYQTQAHEKFYIILRRNAAGEIDAVTTNLQLYVFRWLMLLMPKSMLLYPYLRETDFWLVDQNVEYGVGSEALAQDADYVRSDLVYIKAIVTDPNVITDIELISADRLELMKKILYRIYDDLLDNEKTIIEKVSGKVKKIADFAYKRACERSGYLAEREMFSEPMNDYNQEFVSKQIVEQLEAAKLLNPADKQPKMILFVGEGEARNAASIRTKYPHHICFVLEPFYEFADGAKTRFDEDRILEMYAEELPAKCHGLFDMVFVFNYNIKGGQGDFFRALNRAVKPGGVVAVGRSVCDPEFLFSPKTIGQYLNDHFGNHKIGNTENLKGVIHPDYKFKQVLFVAEKTTATSVSFKSTAEEDDAFRAMINDLNAAESARLMAMGIEGDIDLRRRNDATLLKIEEEWRNLHAKTVTTSTRSTTAQISSCLFVRSHVDTGGSFPSLGVKLGCN